MKSLVVLGDQRLLKVLRGILAETWEVQLKTGVEVGASELVCVTKEEKDISHVERD